MKKSLFTGLLCCLSILAIAQNRKGSSYTIGVSIKPTMELDYKSRMINMKLTGPMNTGKSHSYAVTKLNQTCMSISTAPVIRAEIISSNITAQYAPNGRPLVLNKIFFMINFDAELVLRNEKDEIITSKKLFVSGDEELCIPTMNPTYLAGLSVNNKKVVDSIIYYNSQVVYNATIDKANAFIKRYFCGYHAGDTLYVFSGKGKAYDYTEMESAVEIMKTTVRTIGTKKEDTTLTKQNLQKVIEIWKKELETADLTNPDARISWDIYRGLEYNLASACYFLKQYNEASRHASLARFDPSEQDKKLKLISNFEGRVEDLQFLINLYL